MPKGEPEFRFWHLADLAADTENVSLGAQGERFWSLAVMISRSTS
jgi:hypothetical protein